MDFTKAAVLTLQNAWTIEQVSICMCVYTEMEVGGSLQWLELAVVKVSQEETGGCEERFRGMRA